MPFLNSSFSDSFFGSLNRNSIGSERMKKAMTEGRSVSALGLEPKNSRDPVEKGRAISNPTT